MSDVDDLARAIDAAVADVPGVRDVFSARSLLRRVIRDAVDDDAPRTLVARDGEGLRATVSIGVDGAHPATRTARAAADAARGVLGEDATAVAVRIARVAED